MAVELRKGQKVNLSKTAAGGEMLINLNWTQGIPQKGLFGTIKTQAIDLDLGAFVQLQDNSIHCVQALGKSFGSTDKPPYVSLDGDDRTGLSSGGENLRVNGRKLFDIKRMLIYTFIYEGAANWQQTNGIVTVKYPGGDNIIVKMDEYTSNKKMCAICSFENNGGNLSAEKILQFFNGHAEMDKAFGWGFRWTAGKK